jgi:hypothetical protein
MMRFCTFAAVDFADDLVGVGLVQIVDEDLGMSVRNGLSSLKCQYPKSHLCAS